jgi:hypothetical protein
MAGAGLKATGMLPPDQVQGRSLESGMTNQLRANGAMERYGSKSLFRI